MRLGQDGFYEPRSIDESVVILGWTHEDVSNLSWDEIRSAIQKEHPDEKSNTINHWAGMTHQFAHEASIDDFVIVDLKTHQRVAVGKITGPYTKGDDDEHLRAVEWLRLDIDKSELDEDVQGTLRTPRTFSAVRFVDAVDRIQHIIDTGKDPGPSSDSVEDITVTRDDLPGQSDLMLPALRALNDLGGEAWRTDLFSTLADNLGLTHAMRVILHGDGPKTEFVYRAAWALTSLRNIDAVDRLAPMFWKITNIGRWHLQHSTNEELVKWHRKQINDGKSDLNDHLEQITPIETTRYSVEDIVQDGCFIEQQRISNILERLRSKKNLILQGPPGTGKTWLAKRLAWSLVGRKDESNVRAVQFHPNLSYEDFVRGWRPSSEGRLDLVDGPFLEMAKAAKEDCNSAYVLVIEEINRGNPAQILGELLTLLEGDKRSPDNALELTYRHKGEQGIHLPPNLHVVGTMNVADRSLALVDLALRRRFAFVDLLPQIGERWKTWVREQCGFDDAILSDIQERMSSLNKTIEADPKLGRQFQIGHSYVTPLPGRETHPSAWYRDVVESEIGPLLDEYWFDDLDRAAQERGNLLAGLEWL